jgi:transposase-like protein
VDRSSGWRAVDLMRKLLRKQGFAPKLLVTDKLGSYGSAFRQLRLVYPHDQGLRKNNRIEIQRDEFKTMVNKFFLRSVLDSRQLRLFSPQGRILGWLIIRRSRH